MLRPIGSQRDLGVSACNVLLSAQEAYRVIRQAIDCRIKKLLIYPVLLVNIEKQVQENTGFQLDLSRAKQSEPPADAVLEVLVNKVDPMRIMI